MYMVNYWFVPNTLAPDWEEIDAYLLGVFEPVQEFTWECIAIIHRTNDDDDKLVIVPKWKLYTDEQLHNDEVEFGSYYQKNRERVCK